jgi:hypothetical protein
VGIYRNKKHDEQMQIVVKMMAHASKPPKLIKHSYHIVAHEDIKLMECPCLLRWKKYFKENKKLQEKIVKDAKIGIIVVNILVAVVAPCSKIIIGFQEQGTFERQNCSTWMMKSHWGLSLQIQFNKCKLKNHNCMPTNFQ